MRKSISLILATTILLVTATPATVVGDTIKPYSGISQLTRHEMTINIVLINLPEVDSNQLVWNLEKTILPEVQVPAQPVYMSGISYGVEFRVDHKIVRASQDFVEALKDFLASYKKTQKVPKYLAQYFTEEDEATYDVIDASATERWLAERAADFGGMPKTGYTLLLADVSAVSKRYHYYETRYDSKDTISYKAKYANTEWMFPVVNWMIGWGGHQRFYYVDLSAGSVPHDYSFTDHIPIQEFGLKRVSGFGPKTIKEYKRTTETITNYVADYVSEAVRNLFVPSYVYYPTLSKKYSIQIFLFSEIDRLSKDNYAELLNTDIVKSAFRDLIPSASWDVQVTFRYLREDAGIEKAFESSKIFEQQREVYDNERLLYRYFDERIIYYYLQQNMATYVEKKDDVVILPAFLLLISQGGSIVTSWKNDVRGGYRATIEPERFPRTFGAASYGDMVIGVQSERTIYSWGGGLTQLVIHELGHSVGLMHPFSYGLTQDYVPSAMSYSTYEYRFSQFDKDALARGHADQALRPVIDTFSKIQDISFRSSEAVSIAKAARAEMDKALAEYDSLNYQSAVESSAKISKMVEETFKAEAIALQREFEQTRLLFLSVGLAVGVVVGVVLGRLAFKGREGRVKAEPPLVPAKKHCTKCGQELPEFAMYCKSCGAKQT